MFGVRGIVRRINVRPERKSFVLMLVFFPLYAGQKIAENDHAEQKNLTVRGGILSWTAPNKKTFLFRAVFLNNKKNRKGCEGQVART